MGRGRQIREVFFKGIIRRYGHSHVVTIPSAFIRNNLVHNQIEHEFRIKIPQGGKHEF